MKKRLIKALLCLLITVVTILITNEVKAVTFSGITDTYDDTQIVPYGKEITVNKSNEEELSINKTDIAELLGDNIMRIKDVGHFEVTVKNTSTQKEEKIKFFSWNVYMKNGKFYTYTDVNRRKKSSVLHSKVYLATEKTSEKKTIKVKEHFFAGGYINGKLDGKYITNHNVTKKYKRYFKYSFDKNFTTIEVNKISLNETKIEANGIVPVKQLVATVEPSNATYKEVTWSSSDDKIAKVDNNGNVTILAAGEVVITAKSHNGKTASCKIIISKVEPTEITLNKTSLELAVGRKEQLVAKISPDNATERDITYTSSNSKVAKVNQKGEITAVSEGEAVITAKTSNGKTAECKVKSKIIQLISLEFKDKELNTLKGDITQLSLVFNPSNASIFTLEYKSSNDAVASVDSNGKVTSKEVGEVKITATVNGDKTAECKIIIKEILVEKVTLNKDSLKMKSNETETLKATITPQNATNQQLTWTSSNPSVATVDSNGKVTTIKSGEATITVTTANGKKATCKVTVDDTLTGAEVGQILADAAKIVYDKHRSSFGYNVNYGSAAKRKTYNYSVNSRHVRTSSTKKYKYWVNCEGFCKTVMRWVGITDRSKYMATIRCSSWKVDGVSKVTRYGQTGYLASKVKSKLLPGDILIWRGRGSHLGIYVGDGRVVEISDSGVRNVPLSQYNSYRILKYIWRVTDARAALLDRNKLNGNLTGIEW